MYLPFTSSPSNSALYQFPKRNAIKGLHWASKFTIILVIWTILECSSAKSVRSWVGRSPFTNWTVPKYCEIKMPRIQKTFPSKVILSQLRFLDFTFLLRVWELTHSGMFLHSTKLEKGQRSAFIDKRIYFGCSKQRALRLRSSWMKRNFNCYSQSLIKGDTMTTITRGGMKIGGEEEGKIAAFVQNEHELSMHRERITNAN